MSKTYTIKWYYEYGTQSISIDLPFDSPQEAMAFSLNSPPPTKTKITNVSITQHK